MLILTLCATASCTVSKIGFAGGAQQLRPGLKPTSETNEGAALGGGFPGSILRRWQVEEVVTGGRSGGWLLGSLSCQDGEEPSLSWWMRGSVVAADRGSGMPGRDEHAASMVSYVSFETRVPPDRWRGHLAWSDAPESDACQDDGPRCETCAQVGWTIERACPCRCAGHGPMENRNQLASGACLNHAGRAAGRDAALVLLEARPRRFRIAPDTENEYAVRTSLAEGQASPATPRLAINARTGRPGGLQVRHSTSSAAC